MRATLQRTDDKEEQEACIQARDMRIVTVLRQPTTKDFKDEPHLVQKAF